MQRPTIFFLIVYLIAVLLNQPIFAREVDNYLAWGVELEDVSAPMNEWTKEQFAKGLVNINQRHQKINSCPAAALGMMDVFYHFTYQKIEAFADRLAQMDRFPRLQEVSNLRYLRSSVIERMPFLVPMSRIVNINGIYIGADKFGHFTSFGSRYYKKYLRLLERGMEPEMALKKILKFGLGSEQGMVGKIASQVSSYGDYEANYQGFRFVKSLCESTADVRLVKVNGVWRMVGEFDWKNFINPDMDESFNNSTFSRLRWKTVKKNLIKYCPMLETRWVQNKMSYYRSIYMPSLAKIHQAEIESRFRNLIPQSEHSIEAVCIGRD